MYRITLEWTEEGRTRSQTISDTDNTKEIGKIIIGRDENQCDIALPKSEKTVSRLHVEIFYDSHRKGWFLKNLTGNRPSPNPVVVDGKMIILEEVLLSIGTIFKLGRITLKVTDIEIIQSEYGVKCQNCMRQIPYDYIGDFCPYCGYSLQANETTYLPSEKKLPPQNEDT
ncbi:MAG: FHA domain-containing protein [Cyanobacteria bacterium J06633_8]